MGKSAGEEAWEYAIIRLKGIKAQGHKGYYKKMTFAVKPLCR